MTEGKDVNNQGVKYTKTLSCLTNMLRAFRLRSIS